LGYEGHYNDFIAAGGLPEEFSSDSKRYKSLGNILDGNIAAALEDKSNMTSAGPSGSLKLNDKTA
jgi:hypothetical protein